MWVSIQVIFFLSGSDGSPHKKNKGGGTLALYQCLWNVWGGKAENGSLKRHHVCMCVRFGGRGGGKAKNGLLKRLHVRMCVRSWDISLKYYPKERWSTKSPRFGTSSKRDGIVTQLFLEGMSILLILTIIKLLTQRGPIKLVGGEFYSLPYNRFKVSTE